MVGRRFSRAGIEKQPVVSEHVSDVDVIESQPRARGPHHVGVFGRSGRLRSGDGGCGRVRRPSGAATNALAPRSPTLDSHYLQNLAGLESGSRKEYHRTRYVTRFDANHIRIFVVSEIWNFFRLFHPRIPYHSVWKVIFLYPHFSSRHYIRYNVFLRSVSIYSVCPFTYSNYIATFLIRCTFSRLKSHETIIA